MKLVLSFRTQLMLLNTMLVILIYAVAAFFIYAFMKNRIESVELEKLQEQVSTVSTVVYKSGGDYNDWYHLGDQKPFLIMEDWKVSYQTTAWKDLNFPDKLTPGDFNNKSLKTYSAEQHNYLVKINFVRTGIDTMHNFQVVVAMENTEALESVEKLARSLVLGIPLILILAVAGSFFLSNHAMGPVKLLRIKAQQISAQSLSLRLPVINARDDIGQLTIVFNDLLTRLEYTFEQLKRFTADASHEFRTPLTSIRSTGQVALKNAGNVNDFKDAVASMLEDTDRLANLIHDLLQLTRHDAGRLKIDFSKEDLVSHINSVIEELKILAEEKGITISFLHPDTIRLHINPAYFKQAIRNILHNAIKYTPGSGLIEIQLRQEESG
ncbi:MAG: HAMP domain-containing protein, partial [Calditrichaeota bacterium]|nr:HAMP domain-containing protein [Calditrichota bacterium]